MVYTQSTHLEFHPPHNKDLQILLQLRHGSRIHQRPVRDYNIIGRQVIIAADIHGFSLQTDHNGNLVFYNFLKGGSVLAYVNTAIAGINFCEETFNVKVSFEFFAADDDGLENDIKIGLYFNDKLYNAEFIYVYDMAQEMTTYFLAYTDDAEAHPLWVDILEPEVIDLSMFGFSNDYKSQFGPLSDSLSVDGLPLGANYTPFSGDVVTLCLWALVPMLALIACLGVLMLLSKKKKS